MKTFKQFIKEEPTNVTGTNVSTDIPVRKKFAGCEVFEVDSERYSNCSHGKNRYHRYERYVGNDETGEMIREFGRNNPKSGIIVQNQQTKRMMFLKRPKK